LRVLAWGDYLDEDRDVADEPRLGLVVLDLHQVASEKGPTKETEAFVTVAPTPTQTDTQPDGSSGGSEDPDGAEGEEPGGGVKIVDGERRLNKVRIAMKVPWEHWNDIYNEVIDPLAREGAEVRCDVVIIAKGDAAIRENTVELGIKESLSQRGLDAEIQTG